MSTALAVDHAISTHSPELLRLIRDLGTDRSRPVSASMAPAIIHELLEIAAEYAAPGWDGSGALPISTGALRDAWALAQCLPPSLACPDVVPEPSGSLGFEWRNRQGAILAVSLDGKGGIYYAADLNAGRRCSAASRFVETLPPELLEILLDHFPIGA